jgi:hypothetical protein
MVISDLQHLEIADQSIQGATRLGFADAAAEAFAKGKKFAATTAITFTSVYVGKKYVSSTSAAASSSSAAG